MEPVPGERVSARQPEGAGSGDGGGEGHGKNPAPSSQDLRSGRQRWEGVTRKVCEGLGRWGRSGAAELARVCGGGRRPCSEPEESGERRGWGGAGGGRSCSRDPLLALTGPPSLAPTARPHPPQAAPTESPSPVLGLFLRGLLGISRSLGCYRPPPSPPSSAPPLRLAARCP